MKTAESRWRTKRMGTGTRTMARRGRRRWMTRTWMTMAIGRRISSTKNTPLHPCLMSCHVAVMPATTSSSCMHHVAVMSTIPSSSCHSHVHNHVIGATVSWSNSCPQACDRNHSVVSTVITERKVDGKIGLMLMERLVMVRRYVKTVWSGRPGPLESMRWFPQLWSLLFIAIV